ncbi:MAG: DUF222 domain-containing protein [Streptosporangiaceae bacterium]|jgi:hypothetical protein
MCGSDLTQVPSSAADAMAMVKAGLAWLARSDAGSLPGAVQADCLRGLEQAEAMTVAARSAVLATFSAQGGFEDDGHGSARAWLKWRTRVTAGAAAGAVGWMRRLAAHPAVAEALAAADLSASWARHVCEWSDRLPEAHRGDADAILVAAAAGGAELGDLAALAEEMRRRTAGPDGDGGDDGFGDRSLRLATTFGGAGRLEGDLTPQCAAALQAVLDALGKKAGPEDIRSRRQRDHDALEEACRRLIASGCLPERAGQPTQIMLHMGLDQLRGLDGAPAVEAGWTAGQGCGAPAPPGADCDAGIVPVVTGRLDPAILDTLAATLLRGPAPDRDDHPGHDHPAPDHPAPDHPGHDDPARDDPGGREESAAERRERLGRAVRLLIVRHAADLLSGPGGLAAHLRTGLVGPLAASVPLPLDIGAVTDTIPVHLRRAVTARDRRCRFPGCDQPPAACQPHHIIPRSEAGPTSLANLILMCSFHHLIAVHRWGWGITLHPDGTLTATSPDDHTTLHDHGPPAHPA